MRSLGPLLVVLATMVCMAAWVSVARAGGETCGNGVVDPGEECDPYDKYVPVYGSDRYSQCSCTCKLLPRPVPLTLKMGAFYLIGGAVVISLRGGWRKSTIRNLAWAALGVVLLGWGLLEWTGSVAAPFDGGKGVLFHGGQGSGGKGLCEDRRARREELVGRSAAQ